MDAQAFRGARVLVTGASSGIGFDVAARMHACGAHVTLLARNAVALQAAAHRIDPALNAAADSPAYGSAEAGAGSAAATARVGTVVADLRDHARLAAAVGEAVAAMGGLSVLVVSGGNGGAEYLGLDPALPASYEALNQLHVQATLVLMRVRCSVRLRRARPVRGGLQTELASVTCDQSVGSCLLRAGRGKGAGGSSRGNGRRELAGGRSAVASHGAVQLRQGGAARAGAQPRLRTRRRRRACQRCAPGGHLHGRVGAHGGEPRCQRRRVRSGARRIPPAATRRADGRGQRGGHVSGVQRAQLVHHGCGKPLLPATYDERALQASLRYRPTYISNPVRRALRAYFARAWVCSTALGEKNTRMQACCCLWTAAWGSPAGSIRRKRWRNGPLHGLHHATCCL